jgi:hypothetical protein
VEGLVLLVLELVLPLALLAGLVLVEAAALLAGLVQAAFAFLTRKRDGPPSALGRRLRRITLGAAAALGFAIILVQTVFFQPIVRRLAAAVQARAGIELSFASASGNLLAGRVTLLEGRARRTSDPAATFDITAREMEVDVRLLSLISGEVSIEAVRVAGARGAYTRASGVERPPRKGFQADVLLLEDAEIAWTLRRPDRPDFTLPLRVDRLEARPFVARDAAHAVLFRSKTSGTLAGAPFTIRDDGGHATWTAERVPVRVLADFLGEPFDWLSEGTADVVVTDAWKDNKVDLHWKGVLRDPKAAVPERITGLRRKISEGMVALVNRGSREIPLDFTLALNGDGFKGSMSIESLELWDAMAGAVAAELGDLMGFKPGSVGQKSLDWLKRRLKPK